VFTTDVHFFWFRHGNSRVALAERREILHDNLLKLLVTM